MHALSHDVYQSTAERLQATELGVAADLSLSDEFLAIGDVGILDPATGSIQVFFNIALPQEHRSSILRSLLPYRPFPLDFTRDVEHTLVSNEPIICGKGVVTVLGNKSYLSTTLQFTTYLTGYLPSQPSQLELDRCLSGEETVTLKYCFDKRASFGSSRTTVLVPVGPVVKSTLRPYVHEQWRSYITAHWAGWHEYFTHREPNYLPKRHKLVIVASIVSLDEMQYRTLRRVHGQDVLPREARGGCRVSIG